jgi:hypothetical protein
MEKTYQIDPISVEFLERMGITNYSKDQYERFMALVDMICERYRDVKFTDMMVEEPPYGAYFDYSKEHPIYYCVYNDEVCQDISYEEYLRAVEMENELKESTIKYLLKGISEIFADSNVAS